MPTLTNRSRRPVLILLGTALFAAGCSETPKPPPDSDDADPQVSETLKRPEIAAKPDADELAAAIDEAGGNVEPALDNLGVEVFRNAQSQKIEYINFSDRKLTEDGLKKLLPLKDSLKRIALSRTHTTDAMLGVLAGFRELTKIELNQTPVSEAGLEHLQTLPNLRELELRATDVGDAGLKHVGELAGLQMLSLSWTKITDDGVQHLTSLEKLQTLILDDTELTDAAMGPLRELKRLQFLHIVGTKITEDGAAKLRSALPGVSVRGP